LEHRMFLWYAFYDQILNKFFLYYRIRKPKPFRGSKVRIAQSDDGVKFDNILTIKME
jgi:hypothetical protein